MTDITGSYERPLRPLRSGQGSHSAPELTSLRRKRWGRGADAGNDRSAHNAFMPPGEFESLLNAARAGRSWAWSRLYSELAGPVLGYLRVRGAAEPEDLLSEVFLQVVRGLATFDGDSQGFRSWVFTIAHHRLVDERRARGRRPVQVRDDLELSGTEDDPALVVIDRLTDEEIIALLSALTPEQRDVLLLRLLGGLTIEEIAEAIGKTSGAIKALQRRGLQALQKKLI